jgi:diaminopimelate epimerase
MTPAYAPLLCERISSAQPIQVWKMQALGNDFLLVDTAVTGELDWPKCARQSCCRHYGLGADGLLAVRKEADFYRVHMWNPDGTEDFCVNGIRCAARFLYDAGLISERRFSVNCFRKRCKIVIESVGLGAHPAITVDVGQPLLAPSLIPMLLERPICPVLDYPLEILGYSFRINCVSTGVTHSVIFVDELPSDDYFCKFSPVIETHPLFPERTCVLWTVVESHTRLRIRIWERGVGETLGCGSGACAAAVVSRLSHKTADAVRVQSPGGEVNIDFRPGTSVRLTGTAEYICEAEVILT